MPLEPELPVDAIADDEMVEGRPLARAAADGDDDDDLGEPASDVDDSDDLLELLREVSPEANENDLVDDVGEGALGDPVVAPADLELPDEPEEGGGVVDPPLPDDSEQPRLGKPANFGPFRLTVKQPSEKSGRKFGGVEARCPFHKKNSRTDCKKYLQLRSADPEEFGKCVRALKAWCNSATSYNRQRFHLQHHVSIDAAPAEEVVAAGCVADGPAEAVKGDDELDAEADALAAAPVAAGSVAPKAKGRGRGRGKAAPKRGSGRSRGRGRGRQGCCFKAVH